MSSEITNKLVELRANPTMMHRLALSNCQKAFAGIDFPNATSPIAWVTENNALHTSAFMMQAESLARRSYVSLATTEEELYYHMTDTDFADRFAQPAINPEYVINFNFDELRNKGVEDEKTGAVTVVIPWSTVLTAGLINYGFFYSIEIVILRNGGVRVSWIGDLANGVIPLSSNVIDHDIYRESSTGVSLLRLFIPVYQYTLTSKYLNLSASGAMKASYVLTDNYFTAKVWNTNRLTGKLEEVKTTHSDQTYDSDVLTVVLKVCDGILTVEVPDIYKGNSTLGTNLRIDIYTTLGVYANNLADTPIDMYSVSWRDIDKRDTKHSAILSILSSVNTGSVSWTRGGRAPLSIEALKERLKYRGNSRAVPITPKDESFFLEDRGMTVIPMVDNLSDRVYLTTKPVSPANTPTTISPAGVMVYPITLNSRELESQETVVRNGDRLTILPDTLYQYTAGIVKVVPDEERRALDSLLPTELLTKVNQSNYLYSPFHYVMDNTGDYFTLNAYYLDNPSLLGRLFIDDNPTVPYVLNPKSYSFTRTKEGYRLEVIVTKDEALSNFKHQDLFAQLAFVPSKERSRVYLTGTYVGVTGESQSPVFRFDINTRYIIDRNHALYVDEFKANVDDRQSHPVDLMEELDIFIGVYDYKEKFLLLDPVRTDMDSVVQEDLLDKDEYLTLSHNKLTVRFGDAMPTLYSASRNARSEGSFEVHEFNVMNYYPNTVLEMDPATGYPKVYIKDGEVTFNTLHERGDPVMKDGVHEILYPAGSIKYDAEGNKIPLQDSEVIQLSNMMFIDGSYRFVTEPTLIEYRDSIPTEVVNWLNTDVSEVTPQLLGRTKLFLAPRRTMGSVEIDLGERVATIEARQSVKVDVWITEDTYANMKLRTSIETTIREIVATGLNGKQIVISDIQSLIKDTLGNDITGCLVYGLGMNNNYQTFKVIGEDVGLALDSALAMRSDGKLVVADSIEINFNK